MFHVFSFEREMSLLSQQKMKHKEQNFTMIGHREQLFVIPPSPQIYLSPEEGIIFLSFNLSQVTTGTTLL